MLKIVTVPNKILNSINKPVVNFDSRLKKLIKEMDKTLTAQQDPPGVGLAAPQVGYNLRLFIIKPDPEAKTEVFINPKIVKISQSQLKSVSPTSSAKTDPKPISTKLEGCLSIPRIWGPIKRAKKILIEYQMVEGTKLSKWYSGFKAVIIQHEIDHLDGILFTQRAIEQKSTLFEEKNKKLEKLNY